MFVLRSFDRNGATLRALSDFYAATDGQRVTHHSLQDLNAAFDCADYYIFVCWLQCLMGLEAQRWRESYCFWQAELNKYVTMVTVSYIISCLRSSTRLKLQTVAVSTAFGQGVWRDCRLGASRSLSRWWYTDLYQCSSHQCTRRNAVSRS